MTKHILLIITLAANVFLWPAAISQADGNFHRHGRIVAEAPSYHAFTGWRNPLGRVDIEVEPEDAQVFVDGNFVGTAGKLDGWPNYLYLSQGTYKITLVHPGYETVTHNVAIFPRQRMTLELPLVPGASTPPPPSTQGEPAAAVGDPSHGPAL